MDLQDMLVQVTTPQPLREKIHALRDQLLHSLSQEQKNMFMALEDLYTEEDLAHLTAAHTLLSV